MDWYIDGILLTYAEVRTAKRIISGEIPFDKLPLYLGHPKLKYFCAERLK